MVQAGMVSKDRCAVRDYCLPILTIKRIKMGEVLRFTKPTCQSLYPNSAQCSTCTTGRK